MNMSNNELNILIYGAFQKCLEYLKCQTAKAEAEADEAEIRKIAELAFCMADVVKVLVAQDLAL